VTEVKSIKKEAGLALRANRIIPRIDSLEALKQLASASGGEGQRLVDLISEMGVASEASGFKGMSKLITGFNKKLWDSLLEFRYGAMLSAPAGVVADAFGNAVKTFVTPVEKILAGVGNGVTTRDYSLIKEGFGTYVGLFNTVTDAIKLAGTSLKLGETVLDNSIEGKTFAITAANYGLDQQSSLGLAIDTLGKIVRLPSRIRMTGDEFFKQWNYRALLWHRFSQEALDAAASGVISPTHEAIQALIRQKMDEAVDLMGRGTEPEALQYAREQTFSQPLQSRLGRLVMNAANEHRSLRLIVPFIKTPTNILRDIVGHTPLIGTLLQEQRQALFYGSSAQRAQVAAKWAVGGLLYSGAAMLAQQGSLTGSGGLDRQANEAKRISGWQPYSLALSDGKGGTNYYAYNRLDPFGAFLGLAADYVELSQHMDGKGTEKTALAMMGAFSQVVLSKTYLKGLSDLIQAVNDPKAHAPKLAQNLASSFVPQGLAVANPDPYIREVQSIMDGMKRKIPGLSTTLSPSRNVLGEPISKSDTAFLPDGLTPVYFSKSSSDPVKLELASLNAGLSNPTHQLYGVDLSQLQTAHGQNAYDRLLELVGQVKVGGKTVHDALASRIASPDYQTLKAAGEALTPERQQEVNKILLRFHQEARRQLLKENPTILKAVHDAKQTDITQQVMSLGQAIRTAKNTGQTVPGTPLQLP